MSMSPDNENAASVTTVEDERVSLGQRRVNLIWETTQSLIALTIIGCALAAAVWVVVQDPSNRLHAFLFLSNAVSTVIGFYFGRTNHQRTGGVGGSIVGR